MYETVLLFRVKLHLQLILCTQCLLWPNRKVIKDPNCGAQKGSGKTRTLKLQAMFTFSAIM